MWVIGLFEGDGNNNWDLNVRQYVCSGVLGEGPGASLTGPRGMTGADILVRFLQEEIPRDHLIHGCNNVSFFEGSVELY